jgi:ADP-glucose type glycogen/starch synthase
MHQGKADVSKLEWFGITQKNEFQDPENPNSLNLLKSAMIYADQITTVSPTYAKEILSHEFSYHLDETIWKCKEKTTGILNGIDYDYFNPYSPSKLPFPFPQTPSSECIIQAKKKNKELLQKELGLEICSKPLFCSITRLDYQKGPNLIAHVSKKIAEHQGQFIILGQATTPYFASIFTSLKEHLEPKKNFVYIDKFDEDLSKKLFAASDFIFIPSMFEPCGLTQMIGMRFGSIPIARKTGGLIDTVIDFESKEAKEEDKTGVTFFEATEQEADKAISRALSLHQNKELYKKILSNIICKDFSWKHSAQEYLKIYDRLKF